VGAGGGDCTGRVDLDAACGPASAGGYFAGKVGTRGNVQVRRGRSFGASRGR
jgi:hypothetical protein